MNGFGHFHPLLTLIPGQASQWPQNRFGLCSEQNTICPFGNWIPAVTSVVVVVLLYLNVCLFQRDVRLEILCTDEWYMKFLKAVLHNPKSSLVWKYYVIGMWQTDVPYIPSIKMYCLYFSKWKKSHSKEMPFKC